jgi:hypothetical protein
MPFWLTRSKSGLGVIRKAHGERCTSSHVSSACARMRRRSVLKESTSAVLSAAALRRQPAVQKESWNACR